MLYIQNDQLLYTFKQTLTFRATCDFNICCVITSVFKSFQNKKQGNHGPFPNQFKFLVPMAPNTWKDLRAPIKITKDTSTNREAFGIMVMFTFLYYRK